MKSFLMLRFVILLSMLSAGWSVPAAQPLNTVTRAELSEGWILLFDGETTFGWTNRGAAEWKIEDASISALPDSGTGMICTTSEFADFHLKLDFWLDAQINSGVFIRCPAAGVITANNSYEVNIYDPHPAWPSGSINEIARAAATVKTVNQWNSYEIIAQGTHLKVILNGITTVDVRDEKHARGVIALQHFGTGAVKFRNIKLRPLGTEPIFNGRDLSGWKVLPEGKSVYSVTPEGWLNVKDGRGDIQTTSEYGDFVLQLEIISNGAHLNSGLFFRALPGQFWSGYESQIRNQWQGEDRTKPVDYGTGGIYNRQPARRVVSTDHEWFSKTIVAAGPHLAVWIDGIQVSDFTDTRPPNESARRGYRAGAGVISLQGHDPTTDLSFRNIRAAEYPAPRPQD